MMQPAHRFGNPRALARTRLRRIIPLPPGEGPRVRPYPFEPPNLRCYTRPTIMPLDKPSNDPVIRGVRYFLAHAPGMVQHGSKPSRDLLADPGLAAELASHLRSYQQTVA